MIQCIGWYNHRNVGDEAFKLGIPQVLGRDDIEYTVDNISDDALLVLGGGDVIKSFYLDELKRKGKRFYVLGAGLGYESEIELLKSDLVKGVAFRNKTDVILAQQAGLMNVCYIPDLAFAIDVPLYIPKTKPPKKKLGVFVTDCINPSTGGASHQEISYGEYMKWELASSLYSLCEWYDIVFVPMSHDWYSFDVKTAYDIVNRMPNFKKCVSVIDKPMSPMDTMEYIGNLDMVVSMKFHAMIFSVMMGTPFVNIGLTRKTQLFCKEEDLLRYSIQDYSFTKDRFIACIELAERGLDAWRLLGIYNDKKDEINRVAKSIRNAVNGL